MGARVPGVELRSLRGVTVTAKALDLSGDAVGISGIFVSHVSGNLFWEKVSPPDVAGKALTYQEGKWLG